MTRVAFEQCFSRPFCILDLLSSTSNLKIVKHDPPQKFVWPLQEKLNPFSGRHGRLIFDNGFLKKKMIFFRKFVENFEKRSPKSVFIAFLCHLSPKTAIFFRKRRIRRRFRCFCPKSVMLTATPPGAHISNRPWGGCPRIFRIDGGANPKKCQNI